MSPRYFAKFTGSHPQNAGNWYHFAASDYKHGSPEEKIHSIKDKIYNKIYNFYLKLIKLR